MPSKISPAEWEVLSVLWEKSPASVPEVAERLAGRHEWHPKTVATFLTRLVQKGLLKVKRSGKVNLYTPRKTREECVRAEGDSFLQRVFKGSFGPMLLHFVEQADLAPEEIAELEQLLKQKKGQR